jgi:hypothetical protein
MFSKITFLTIGLICFSVIAYSQSPADSLARRIAGRMKDTLLLTPQQETYLYTINMQLHQQKQSVRQNYGSNIDSLRINIQRVENTRDSLYKNVLESLQYEQYIQRKRNLVNNN